MPNLKEVRTRIASIKSTRQITSAMKMVSASKLRKGQNAILSLRPYAGQLKQMLDHLNAQLPEKEKNVLCVQQPIQRVLVLVFTSNKGLCGNFNASVVKGASVHIRSLEAQGFEVSLWTIGRRGDEFFRKSKHNILHTTHEIVDHVSFEKAQSIAHEVMDLVRNQTFQRVDVVYSSFKNAAQQELVMKPFLPMQNEAGTPSVADPQSAPFGYILEPGLKEILDDLLPKSIETLLYSFLLDSYASEHGARMTAMHQATDNATELLKNLTITYNKVRQASITREIVEIVSGAEALNG